jgi:hypothetical protein
MPSTPPRFRVDGPGHGYHQGMAEPSEAEPADAVPTQAQDKAHVKEMAAHLAEVEKQTDEARQRSKRDHLLHDDDNELTGGWDSEPA